MDSDTDSQLTQQATQTIVDPRRLGQQNSGFTDEDVTDIVCLLFPESDGAREQLVETAQHSTQHLLSRDDAQHVSLATPEGLALDRTSFMSGDIAIILRLSATVKSPREGYTFGRNNLRCDLCFYDDKVKRLSNVHFRIYLNQYGVLMVEDRSTNGTFVDGQLLKAKSNGVERHEPRTRTLSNGSEIRILMADRPDDLSFRVRIPHREGDYAEGYRQNIISYLDRIRTMDNAGETITPGPNGHPDLFGNVFTPDQPPNQLARQKTQEIVERMPRDWNGSNKYNRVCQIGKGAFAIVYKVTDKFDGRPYAAKELDKKKFMKNGVLDQKVENEMNIMQRIKHPHIVEYIEHFEWDNRLFYIIMDYVPHGDLGKLINENRPLVETIVKDMGAQLLDALDYLHHNNIIHRDVKPDNILIQSYTPLNVKLTDFGLSKMVDEGTFLKTFCGTLLYCAPEVYSEFAEYDAYGRRDPRNRRRQQPSGKRYDEVIDVWSLGGVLFYAFTGLPPYPVKSGISYSELLHQIMTKDLDIWPLQENDLSITGIDFFRRMLQRRPEQRATVGALLSHAWLSQYNISTRSLDDSTDHKLTVEASQLSLNDQAQHETIDDDRISDSEASFSPSLADQENNIFVDDKENQTLTPPGQGRKLFGEVGASALRSSGIFPSTRLNLPVSGSDLNETQILGEIQDSYATEDSLVTPKQQKRTSQQASIPLALSQSPGYSSVSFGELNSGGSSLSLSGAESIMGNLHMKSVAPSHVPLGLQSFASSKRKPVFDSSDEFERSQSADKPFLKRLKSSLQIDAATDPEEIELTLLAMMPPIRRLTERQFDEPVHKSSYWDSHDNASCHVTYPEMTQLQHDAFVAAAQNRGEIFAPDSSPLWQVAMRHFPPMTVANGIATHVGSVDLGLSTDDRALNMTPPSSTMKYDDDEDLPATLVPDSILVAPPPEELPRNRVVATLESTSNSVISNIKVSLNAAFASFGRAKDCTHVFEASQESRVPVYAFKLMLWKEKYEPSRNFRPWTSAPHDFHWYISTKATNGIWINGILLPSDDPKNKKAPSRHWIRLYDGDSIVIWRSSPVSSSERTQLVFRCDWGGSSAMRPPDGEFAVPSLVPPQVASRLDEICPKAEKRIVDQMIRDEWLEKADADFCRRKNAIEQERQRSYEFEACRMEACRVLAGRMMSRRESPAGTASAVTTQSVVPKYTGSPTQEPPLDHSTTEKAWRGNPYGHPSASAPPALVATTTPAYGQFSAGPGPSPLGGLRERGLPRRHGSPGVLRAMVEEKGTSP